MSGREPNRRVDPQVKSDNNGRYVVIAACITAVLGLVGVIIATFGHGTTTASPPKVITIAGCSKPTLTITSPRAGEQVAGQAGVRVTGTACGLSGDSGWLFDSDTIDKYYYEVYPDDPGPVVESNGSWATVDQPIGDPADRHKSYDLTLVLASPSCADALRALQPTNGDLKTLAFPAGCRIAGQVRVLVTG